VKGTEAVDLISRTTFRPGMKFSASAGSDYNSAYLYDMLGSQPAGRSNYVTVYLSMKTKDTSHCDPDGEYRREIGNSFPSAFWAGDVTDMTENELLRAVLDKFHETIDMHEDREFLRVRQPDGTWFAPFHPHRADGDAAWYESGLAGRRREYRSRSLA
jgi:hypothetical protein